jgi:hypothetical protein
MPIIYTHNGNAHRDEFLAIALILAKEKDLFLIRRVSEIHEVELEDPNVFVIDIGRQYDPQLRNFDHHQLPADADPTCSFSLILDYYGINRDYLPDWVAHTVLMDSKGPTVVAKQYGLATFPSALFSPIEDYILEYFNIEFINHNDLLYRLMIKIGNSMIDEINKNIIDYEIVKQSHHYVVNGIGILISDCDNPAIVSKYKKVKDFDISIVPDSRNGGWSLYRYNDHPRINFCNIKDENSVLFAHNSGFIAKTKNKIPDRELLELCQKAIK